jgi:hypothetical protein
MVCNQKVRGSSPLSSTGQGPVVMTKPVPDGLSAAAKCSSRRHSRHSRLSRIRRLESHRAAPKGRSRRRLGRLSRVPASLPRSWPLTPVGWRERLRHGAAETGGSHGAAADLTREPLAAAPSGLCGRPGKAARSRTSVQPPPPCQIHRSGCAELGTRRAPRLTIDD